MKMKIWGLIISHFQLSSDYLGFFCTVIFNTFLNILWYFIFLGKHMCFCMHEGEWRYFLTSGLQEMAWSIFVFTNFWNKDYPITLMSVITQIKTSCYFLYWVLCPLHRCTLILLRNGILAVKYDRRICSMLRVFPAWNHKMWLKTSESKNIFK